MKVILTDIRHRNVTEESTVTPKYSSCCSFYQVVPITSSTPNSADSVPSLGYGSWILMDVPIGIGGKGLACLLYCSIVFLNCSAARCSQSAVDFCHPSANDFACAGTQERRGLPYRICAGLRPSGLGVFLISSNPRSSYSQFRTSPLLETFRMRCFTAFTADSACPLDWG